LIARDASEVAVGLESAALFEPETVVKAVILKETRKIVVGEVPDAEIGSR
jgi:hypothetical protein